MTQDRKQELRDLIANGSTLTQEQDDDAYALLPPEEYYAIPDDQKPTSSLDDPRVDHVKEALEDALRILTSIDPVAYINGVQYIDWCATRDKVSAALASYDNYTPPPSTRMPTTGVNVRCLTDGQEFPSIAATARFYGVSATMISNHLARKPGYKHVRGMIMERF